MPPPAHRRPREGRGALKTASGLQVDTSLKLTKKNGVPMLTFEIKGQGQGPDVQHDVPLRIVTDVDELAVSWR